jgi:hypothetical protein
MFNKSSTNILLKTIGGSIYEEKVGSNVDGSAGVQPA